MIRLIRELLLLLVVLGPTGFVVSGSTKEHRAGQIGDPTVSDLIRVLKDERPSTRVVAAAVALGKVKPTTPDIVKALTDLLESPDHHFRLRHYALQSLNEIGLPAASASGKIMRCLSDSDWGIRWYAAAALAKMGPAGRKAIPRLIESINDQTQDSRCAAIDALGDLRAEKAIPALMTQMHRETWCRGSIALALGKIGSPSRPAVSDLIAMLDDKTVRQWAIDALGGIGAAAATAIPRLTRFLQEPETRICQGSSSIIGHEPTFTCAYYAAIALGQIGPAAASAVPSLFEVAEKSNGDSLVMPFPENQKGDPFYSPATRRLHLNIATNAVMEALRGIGTPEALAAVRRFETSKESSGALNSK
ncbi:MAG: HEAT repeat domain-containing protein [Elusimicrobia bacterium]|nr:HEAT repeat domain-containing protein [Elusimicrobiota bacterium]